MGLSFANPAGFWALLGIPAVLIIHLLQRRAKVLPISTLFLLDQLHRESVGGRNFERLRSSIPLWLQLLMVCLLGWLLAGPRWLQKHSLHRVVIVLDSSASMGAFKTTLMQELEKEMRNLAPGVTTTEYTLMESLLEKETLYHGIILQEMIAAVDKWVPFSGSHDPGEALRVARSLAGKDGLVVFTTDHILSDLPSGARILAVGEARENVGFAGLTVGSNPSGRVWKATLKNYGSSPQSRQWWVETDGAAGPRTSLTLNAGASRALQGAIPNQAKSMVLQCEGDAFAADDTLPFVSPEPKKLKVSLPPPGAVSPGEDKLYSQIFSSLPDVEIASVSDAQILVSHYDPLRPSVIDRPGLIFLRDSRAEAPWLAGVILVESHPLMTGLNWQSLVCQDAAAITPRESDEVLLWIGARAAIFLRGDSGKQVLCFNFDLKQSNVRKLPAFVVLIHRYVENVRAMLPLFTADNVECGQKLNVACEQGPDAAVLEMRWREAGGERMLQLPPGQVSLLRAPATAGEFTVWQGDKQWLRAAAHFADAREADLSMAASKRDLAGAKSAMAERFSTEDSHWRLWVLLLLGVLVISWHYVRKSNERGSEIVPATALSEKGKRAAS